MCCFVHTADFIIFYFIVYDSPYISLPLKIKGREKGIKRQEYAVCAQRNM